MFLATVVMCQATNLNLGYATAIVSYFPCKVQGLRPDFWAPPPSFSPFLALSRPLWMADARNAPAKARGFAAATGNISVGTGITPVVPTTAQKLLDMAGRFSGAGGRLPIRYGVGGGVTVKSMHSSIRNHSGVGTVITPVGTKRIPVGTKSTPAATRGTHAATEDIPATAVESRRWHGR